MMEKQSFQPCFIIQSFCGDNADITPGVFLVLPVRAKDTINQLKEEISNLSKLVEKGAGLSVGQENMVKELIRVRDELTRKTGEQGQTIAVSLSVSVYVW